MKKRSKISRNSSKSGQVLIVILGFVVLLSVVAVVLLSRAISDMHIAAAGDNQVKVRMAVQGAVAQITSDLQQEIAAGSTPIATVVNGTTYYAYYPSSNAFGAPCPSVGAAAGGLPNPAIGCGYENLLKMSYYQSPFFSNPTTTLATYNGAFAVPNRAANASTLTPSLNSRYVSATRWELPSLTLNLNTNPTSVVFSTQKYIPSWILIAKDGSNGVPGSQNGPGTFDSSFAFVPSVSPAATATTGQAGTNPVLQRYAYTIYDEGGTLDMNVAGGPVTSTGLAVSTVAPYKNALAYADLTKLPGITNLSNSAKSQIINAIVGWRNNASAQPTGNFPKYTTFPTPSSTSPLSLTPFDSNTVLGNPTGFLMVNNTALALNGAVQPAANLGMSDQPFVSRQQLIQVLASIGSANSAGGGVVSFTQMVQQEALTCMGTFSRDVNQPSYAANPNQKVGYPSSTSEANGGNDKGGGDSTINAPFLSFAPSTGTPGVKEKFALSRLAWLTYLGPIADDNMNLNPTSNANIAAIITSLETNYGFTPAFLSQGGPTNIYKYFGLSWVSDTRANGDNESKWVYSHEGTSALTALPTAFNPIRSIGGGTYPIPSSRQPDMFEQLKASLPLGSLGKAYYYTASPNVLTPAGYQEERDNSVDLQVLQIGANIIDQFDTDSYSTRILFSDGSLFGGTVQEIRGVEDLPYIYRVREGKITVTDSTPSQGTCPSISNPTTTNSPGLVAVLQELEIWNPNAWNSSNPDANPRPTSFRAVAVSTDPNSASSTAVPVTPVFYNGETRTSYLSSTPNPVWNEANTELDFSIPQGSLSMFREPTLLIKPNVAGSNLKAAANTLIPSNSNFPLGYIPSKWKAWQLDGGTDNQEYIGFLAGTGPAVWSGTIKADSINQGTAPPTAMPGLLETTYEQVQVNGIDYKLQYKDASGNWETYDEKYMGYIDASLYNIGADWISSNRTFYATEDSNTTAEDIISDEAGEVCFDPRTSRFGCGEIGNKGYQTDQKFNEFPLRRSASSIQWACEASSGSTFTGAMSQMALATQRPDQYSGFSWEFGGTANEPYTGPTALGWYPASLNTTAISTGMFTQNNPAEVAVNTQQVSLNTQTSASPLNQYFADADGVVRRGQAAWVPTDATAPADPSPTSGPWGLPMMVATSYSGATPTPLTEVASRPVILNRPFRSVAELGYVFTGTPWRNLDMSTPEGMGAPLLDTFCINPTSNANELVAGKIDLNTKQLDALEAVLSSAYKDEFYQLYGTGTTSSTATPLTAAFAKELATALINRTSGTAGPLTNNSQLVGYWNSNQAIGASINGSTSYIGFTGDTVNSNAGTPCDINQALNSLGASNTIDTRLSRVREASVRALSAVGTTRVWNLMIDLVVQTGRYPVSATSLDNFQVDSEKRYWVHLAIDRYTDKVIDEQFEEVKE